MNTFVISSNSFDFLLQREITKRRIDFVLDNEKSKVFQNCFRKLIIMVKPVTITMIISI